MKSKEINCVKKYEVFCRATPWPDAYWMYISTSVDVRNFFQLIWPENTMELCEKFMVGFLNKANIVTGFAEVGSGGLSGVVVDVSAVMRAAMLANAAAIIVCHNHPSQSVKPSSADIDITKRLSQAGKIMGVPLLDHIILTSENGFYSFSDEGLI